MVTRAYPETFSEKKSVINGHLDDLAIKFYLGVKRSANDVLVYT